jgi:hypothetical protein
VISPLNSDRAVTALWDFADAFVWTAVTALAVVDWAETIEPSAGYEKAPPAEGAVFGGETTTGVATALAAGGETLIAQAVAAAPGACAGPTAPADPNVSRARGRSSARQRRTVT